MRSRPPLDLTPTQPPPPPASPRRVEAPPRADTADAIKRRLDALLAEDQARRNILTGDVDPWLYEIKRDTEYFFRPGWGLAEGDQRRLGTVGSTTAAFVRGLGRNYLEALRRFADPGHGRPRDQGGDLPTMLETYDMMRRAAEQDSEDRLACTLCVSLPFVGDAPQIELRRSSRRPAFDRLARGALKRAVLRRPALRTQRPVQACFRVAALFTRIPPLPVAGCLFDEVEPRLDCFYPLMKVLKPSVTLVSARYHRP